MNCPYCGKKILTTNRFCGNCGNDLPVKLSYKDHAHQNDIWDNKMKGLHYSKLTWLIITILIIMTFSGGVLIYKKHKSQAQDDRIKAQAAIVKAQKDQYQNQYNSINKIEKDFSAFVSQYYAVPNSTTKTNKEWDSYYSDLIDKTNNYASKTQELSFSNSQMQECNDNLTKRIAVFITVLQSEQASIDWQFQVDHDKRVVQINDEYPTATPPQQASADQEKLKSDQNSYTESQAEISANQSSYSRTVGIQFSACDKAKTLFE